MHVKSRDYHSYSSVTTVPKVTWFKCDPGDRTITMQWIKWTQNNVTVVSICRCTTVTQWISVTYVSLWPFSFADNSDPEDVLYSHSESLLSDSVMAKRRWTVRLRRVQILGPFFCDWSLHCKDNHSFVSNSALPRLHIKTNNFESRRRVVANRVWSVR